ncbi:hypothetical protein D3C79_639910 [compost metagenome]
MASSCSCKPVSSSRPTWENSRRWLVFCCWTLRSMRSIRSQASLRLIASSMISAQRRLSCSLRSSRDICARYSLIALYKASASSPRVRTCCGKAAWVPRRALSIASSRLSTISPRRRVSREALARARLGVSSAEVSRWRGRIWPLPFSRSGSRVLHSRPMGLTVGSMIRQRSVL